MNLKILFLLLLYYSIISLTFVFGASEGIFDDYNSTITINDTDLSVNEQDTGGLFNTGVSFGRFFAFVGFGVGLPSDTPQGMIIFMIAWQTMVSIFSVGFILDSIWSG